MSKYIKLEDAITKLDEWFCEPYTPTELLSDLPTIEVSEDCISREYLKSFEYINKGDFNSVETIREWIDNAPSVVPTCQKNRQVERAEGEWEQLGIMPRSMMCYEIECSECHSVALSHYTNDFPDFCPYCGAKMKG